MTKLLNLSLMSRKYIKNDVWRVKCSFKIANKMFYREKGYAGNGRIFVCCSIRRHLQHDTRYNHEDAILHTSYDCYRCVTGYTDLCNNITLYDWKGQYNLRQQQTWMIRMIWYYRRSYPPLRYDPQMNYFRSFMRRTRLLLGSGRIKSTYFRKWIRILFLIFFKSQTVHHRIDF